MLLGGPIEAESETGDESDPEPTAAQRRTQHQEPKAVAGQATGQLRECQPGEHRIHRTPRRQRLPRHPDGRQDEQEGWNAATPERLHRLGNHHSDHGQHHQERRGQSRRPRMLKPLRRIAGHGDLRIENNGVAPLQNAKPQERTENQGKETQGFRTRRTGGSCWAIHKVNLSRPTSRAKAS